MYITMIYGGGNDLGRAYCLWLLMKELGWTSQTYATNPQWAPLEGSGFQARGIEELTRTTVIKSDAIIVYQPVPETLGRFRCTFGNIDKPVLLDIDDPHWEQRFGYSPAGRARVVAGLLRRGRSPLEPYGLRRFASSANTIIASPFATFGTRARTFLVPHVREALPVVAMPDTERLQVAFVGSPRKNKGLDRLRRAVTTVGATDLWITAPPPPDALPHEHWVGTTTLREGRVLLNKCHVSAVLQDASRWSQHQFPVKTVDAMMAGRVVLGSNVPPVQWALNSRGITVDPSSGEEVKVALRFLNQNRDKLVQIGAKARLEAERRFTPRAVAPDLARAVEFAIDSSQQ